MSAGRGGPRKGEPPGRGGAREGAGRPLAGTEALSERLVVRVTPTMRAAVDAAAGDDYAAFVRAAIAAALDKSIKH